MMNVNSSDLIYDPKFLTFCSLATEGMEGIIQLLHPLALVNSVRNLRKMK